MEAGSRDLQMEDKNEVCEYSVARRSEAFVSDYSGEKMQKNLLKSGCKFFVLKLVVVDVNCIIFLVGKKRYGCLVQKMSMCTV